MRMKKVVLDLWVKALRSGEYTQGHGTLRATDKDGKPRLCCLGVLCEVAIKEGVPLTTTEEEYSSGGTYVTYDGASAYPPESVEEWAGLTNTSGLHRHDPASWNDSDHETFETIASRLEERVETY